VNAAAVTALVFFVGPGVDPTLAAATQAVVKERLARDGDVLVDLSAEHRKLFTKSPFVDFTIPPPAFLPPELAATWKRGNEACAERTGPTGAQLYPPQRVRAAASGRACAQDVGRALWPLFLEARHVKRVVSMELAAVAGSRGGAGGVVTSTWLFGPGPDWKGRVIAKDDVSADQVTAFVASSLESLLKGGGDQVPAAPVPVPSVGVPGLDAVAVPPPAPAKLPASCAGLPARLEVFPLGKLTRAIESAYKTIPADKRTGPPLRCDLVAYPDDGGRDEGPLVRARLACPPSQARAGAKVAEAAKLVPWLVDDTVAALCWAQGTQ